MKKSFGDLFWPVGVPDLASPDFFYETASISKKKNQKIEIMNLTQSAMKNLLFFINCFRRVFVSTCVAYP